MPDGRVKTVHVRARTLAEKLAGKSDTLATAQFVGAVMDITTPAEAYAALERSERRYRYLFDHMPVALIQIRLRGRVSGRQIIDQLRSEGVIDLLGYLDQHPEYVRDLLDGATIESVNEQAIRMFGARDASELIAMPYAWLWRERPDTFRRILESRFQGKWTYQEETRIVALDGRPIDVFFTVARPERVDSDAGPLYAFINITESARTRRKPRPVRFALQGLLAAGQITLRKVDG
jgi:PAS domain-containing protein